MTRSAVSPPPNAAGSTYQRDAWGAALEEVATDRSTVNQTFEEASGLKARVDTAGVVTASWTYGALNGSGPEGI